MTRIRPPFKYYGGKYYQAKWIISHFPDEYEKMVYVEPYGGAASVLLTKLPSKVEVYNDLDDLVINFFHVLRNDFDELQRQLSVTLYHEGEHRQSKDLINSNDPMVKAVAFYVNHQQSVGGIGGKSGFGYGKKTSRRGMPLLVSAWLTSISDNLPLVADRLIRVQFMQRSAMKVIHLFDSPDTFFYLDPPYLADVIVGKKIYQHGMTIEQHQELLNLLTQIKGRFILSGYMSPLYDSHAKRFGWVCYRKDSANMLAAGREIQSSLVDCIWTNITSVDYQYRQLHNRLQVENAYVNLLIRLENELT